MSTAAAKLRASRPGAKAALLLDSKLVRGGLVVGACILLGNISGFFRVAITAYLLGTHARADALAVAIGPVDTLNLIVVNTMLFAFVPMLMLREGGERAALFARAGRIFAWILLGVSLFTAVFAPELATLLGPGLAAPQHDQAVTLFRLFAPSTLLAGSAAIFSALLYTERRFVVPGLHQTCINVATTVGAVFLGKVMGVNGFAVGYTCGAALQLLLTWRASRDLRSAPQAALAVPLSEVLLKPGMFLLYGGLIAANIVVTRAYATHGGPGMAAAFDYCMRCVNVLAAYMVYPVATTLLPEISRLRGQNQLQRAYRLIDKGVGLTAMVAIAVCAVGLAFRTPMVAILYQRGNFTGDSTRLVAQVFAGFVPSLLGWVLMDLIARCFFALDRPRLPVITAFIPIAVNLAVMSILRARGSLAEPAMLGVGASIGLMAGFLVLFVLIHVRRKAESPAPYQIGLKSGEPAVYSAAESN